MTSIASLYKNLPKATAEVSAIIRTANAKNVSCEKVHCFSKNEKVGPCEGSELTIDFSRSQHLGITVLVHNLMNNISDDAVLHVLSYLGKHQWRSVKLVNQNFRALVAKADIIRIRDIDQNISSHFEMKNIWFVDPSGVSRRTEIRKKGWRGPIKSIDKAVKRAESGDKIVLSSNQKPYLLLYGDIEKDVIFEGEVTDRNTRPTLQIPHYRYRWPPSDDFKVWFLNLCIEKTKPIGDKNASLWFRNCDVKYSFEPCRASKFFACDSTFESEDLHPHPIATIYENDCSEFTGLKRNLKVWGGKAQFNKPEFVQ